MSPVRAATTAVASLGLLTLGFGLNTGYAQTADESAQRLAPVVITGEAEGQYQTKRASSPQFNAPLRDVPQSVTVIPAELIRE
ncbi:hypothetical protein [Lampropedia cohaerens]|uniref:hypothetical protein n=1 Tax=Lampropedia cohaerens TaxID=1610491 RepID=UPI0012E00FD2|nr:hypothetical protein [Lampropedia cohaerens]